LQFDGAGWSAQPSPNPGFAPEPTPALLIALGLLGLAIKGTPRKRTSQ
jgi:hypothetical protein